MKKWGFYLLNKANPLISPFVGGFQLDIKTSQALTYKSLFRGQLFHLLAVWLFFSPLSCKSRPSSLDKEPVIKIGKRVWGFGELRQKLHFAGLLNSLTPAEAKKELLKEMALRSLVENWAEKNKIRWPRPPLTQEEKAIFGRSRALMQAFRDHKSYKSLYQLFLKDIALSLPEASLNQQKKFYSQNKSLFFELDACFFKQIVVEKKKQALSLRRRIEEGASFDRLSRSYSQQKSALNRAKKGDLEVFDRVCFGPSAPSYRPSPEKKFLSPVVKSPYGYHVFLIEGIKPGRQKSFAEAQELILSLLRESALSQEIRSQLRRQIKATPVWTNQKLWSKVHSLKRL